MIQFEYIHADSLLIDSFRLGKKLYENGFIPTHAVSLWRGGTPVGLGIDEYFRLKGHFINHITFATSSYSDIRSQGKIQIKGLEHLIQIISKEDKLLIIDDIYDSGETIEAVLQAIKAAARANTPDTIGIACAYNKLRRRRVNHQVNVVENKKDVWINFPHEVSDLLQEDDPEEARLRDKSETIYQILHEKSDFPITTSRTSEDYYFIKPQYLLEEALKLATNIYHDGFFPDYLIAIWKDGINTAIPIHEYYKYQLKKNGKTQKTPDPIVINTAASPLSYCSTIVGIPYLEQHINANDKILLVDTLFHTGRLMNQTIETLKASLKRNISLENIRIASLYYFPEKDTTTTGLAYYEKPHYYLHEISKTLILPYQIHKLPKPETELKKRWSQLWSVLYL